MVNLFVHESLVTNSPEQRGRAKLIPRMSRKNLCDPSGCMVKLQIFGLVMFVFFYFFVGYRYCGPH